jgi:hypothetical protein
MFKNYYANQKNRMGKRLFKTILSILVVITLLPLDVIDVFAADKLIGIPPIGRAVGVSVDSFAVNEMMIEHLKPRSVSQTALRDLAANILPGGDKDPQVASELIDDFLRMYGLPASRQNVNSSVILQSWIKTSIDANLPVALIGTSHQVVVDGYNDNSGFSVHVLDPASSQGSWSNINGVSLSNPSFVILEIVTIYSSVTIKTADYGTMTYSTVSNTLSGGTPPASSILKEAIKSSAPYVTASDTLYLINYGTGANNIGLFAAILNPSQWGGKALIEAVLRSWEQDSFNELANFPILPLDDSGYLDVANVAEDIESLSLAYRLYPHLSTFSSNSKIYQEEIDALTSEHNHFWLYHHAEDRGAMFELALREMLSYQDASAATEKANEDMAYDLYKEEMGITIAEMGMHGYEITEDIVNIVDPQVLWGKVWQGLYEKGWSKSDAIGMANRVRAKHLAMKKFFWKQTISSAVIDLGLDAAKQLIWASQPVVYLEESADELIAIKAKLGSSGDDLLVRQAIDHLVLEINGQTNTFWGKLVNYWNSGQFQADFWGKTFETSVGVLAEIASEAWGLPIIGQIYSAIHLGWVLGNLLTNNEDVHDKLHLALYAKDLEAIFHRIAYNDIRPTLITQYQAGLINKSDLAVWDSAVHLTYLSEAYYWRNVADAFNATGLLTNLLTALNGYGTAQDAAKKYFMPNAVKPATYAKKWESAPSTQTVIDVSEKLLFERKAGAVIAQVISPKSGSSVTGTVTINYLAESTTAPVDVLLKIDGNQLDSKTDVNPDYYQYIWNSSPNNDGKPHNIYLKVTDNNGAIAEDNVTVVVGSPGNGNTAPNIALLGPNNEKAFRYYNVNWTDSDPDDNAIITLGYDTNNTGCDGTTIQNWISEDWTTNWWTWRDLPGSSGSSYWVYAIIKDDLHDPKCVYSPGSLTIETPSSGNGYLVDHVAINDDDYGDGDGIWESEERVDLKVYIKNNSSVELDDVYGVVSGSSTSIAINDEDATIWASTPGVIRDGTFEMTAAPGFSGNVPIQLDIYYRENGGSLKKDTETLNAMVSQVGAEPAFQITGISFLDNDLTQADNDGVPESGEDNIYTTITIKNNGGATASNVTAVLSAPAEFAGRWANPDVDYPDLAPGQTAGPLTSFLRLDDIPANFSGILNMTMTVYYGVDQEFSKTVNFQVDVKSVPRIKLLELNYDFGVVSPGTQVTHDFQVTNIGTQTANITGVSTSNLDLTFTNTPTTIIPGGTATFHSVLNTTGLDSSITRTFTINSNAHSLSKNTGTVVGTVHDIQSLSFQLLYTDPPATGYNSIDGGDSDNDGLTEIYATDIYLDPITSDNYSVLIVYEQTSVASDNFTEVYRSSNTAMPGSNYENSMVASDVNNDGKTEVFVVTGGGTGTAGVYYIASNGNNSFSITRVYTLSGYYFVNISVGDPDSDGAKDLIVGRRNSSTSDYYFDILEYGGGTTFTKRWTSPLLTYTYKTNTMNAAICASAASDTDLDGHGEAIVGTDYGQVQIFESTGNNVYSSTPRKQDQLETNLGGTSSICDVSTGDLDGDSRPEIIYNNDDSNKLYILESTADNTWNLTWAQGISPLSGDDSITHAIGDINGNGKLDVVLFYNGSPDGIVIYEAFADNSYAPIFTTTDPLLIENDAVSIAVRNIDNTSLQEILIAHDDGLSVWGLAKDLIVSNLTVEPVNVMEGVSTTISASVANNSGQALTNVGVAFYNGDPSAGGSPLGTTSIASIASGGSATATLTKSFSTTGTFTLFVLADPDNQVSEANEGNNKKSTSLTVVDNDQDPPQIYNISITEYGGNGNGLFEDNEQMKINWTATDVSGIASIDVSTDCTKGAVSPLGGGNYQLIIGPCVVGEHSFYITAVDGDNSPSARTSPYVFFQILNHQPVVSNVSPGNGATNISRTTSIQVWFGTGMNAGSITTTTFTLETTGGQLISGSLSYDPFLKKATFVPGSKLAAQTSFRATLHGGVNGIRDANNNALDSSYVWQFTTLPNQPPAAPFSPAPANGGTNISSSANLSWQANDVDGDPLTFTVYFGTTNPPSGELCSNIQVYACDPGQLEENQTYYWKVLASDGLQTTHGPTWSFVTHKKAPEMDMVIQDGETIPNLDGGSDFGSALVDGGTINHSYTIYNTGDSDLVLTELPQVSVVGDADFVVTVQPASLVPAGGSTTFTVMFDPNAAGLRTATISIANNDSNENPYNFSIQGTGVIPTNVPPTVVSVTRVNTNPTNLAKVNFMVTFSEAVTGVNIIAPYNDFHLVTSGVSGASIASVRGSGTSYSVSVNTGTGTGMIRLDVVDDDSIKDANDNPLGGLGAGNGNFVNGEAYTITQGAIINIGAQTIGDYPVLSHPSTFISAPNVMDGPIKVTSARGGNLFSSVRVVSGSSFNEFMGYPTSQLTTEYWFPWYDSASMNMNTWIMVGNPSSIQSATVSIYVGTAKYNYTIPAGGRIKPRYPGLKNGPVRVVSTNGVKIFTSERTLYNDAFNEVMGYPANQLTTEYWFPWYDSATMNTWVLVGNPSSTQTAKVSIYVGTIKYSYSIPPKGRITPRYPGLKNGPVRVVSTNGVKIFTSERAQTDTSFNEVMGYPANQFTTDYWFPWYDNVNMGTWVLVGNPTASTAKVDIYIGGVKRGSYSIPANGRITPRYTGLNTGPVHVVSTNGVKIFTSERVLYGPSLNLNEFMGYPGNKLTTEYWFPWYDSITQSTDIVVGTP